MPLSSASILETFFRDDAYMNPYKEARSPHVSRRFLLDPAPRNP